GPRRRPHPDLAPAAHRQARRPGGRAGRARDGHPGGQRRARRRGRRGGAVAPPARGGRADRRRARDDEGRGDEDRPGHVLPGPGPRAARAPRGLPAQARRPARRGAEGVLQGHAPGHRGRVRREARRRLRHLRPGADRGRVDRPGLQGAPARRPGRRRQGPVPRRGGRRPRRHAEPRPDPADHEAGRPGARPGGDRGGDPLAHPRGARLRARGGQPARAGADLPRPPVHRRARGGHRPLAREGRRLRVRLGARVRRAQAAAPGRARPPGGDRLPLLLRVHVPRAPVLGRPASRQLAAPRRRAHGLPGLRPLQADLARGLRVRAPDAAPGLRGARRRPHLPPARGRPHRPSRVLRPGRDPAPVRRPVVVVHPRPGHGAHAGGGHPRRHPDERPAVAVVREDAPRDAPARPPLRPAAGDADPGRDEPAARPRQ
ncbi:MAG: Ubiquinone biosynthesis monooxygenase UbiB, partial [uncultured Thermoleophilia bacterium]